MKNQKYHFIETSVKKEAFDSNIHRVLLALSGGADSIATAYALQKAGIEIMALHCNFHLRGKESDRDANFVEIFCRNNNIPLKTIDFNVKEYIEENPGNSIEMACRNLRHEWFEKQLDLSGYDRIATGHNADDNIETFLLNMLRGSGTRGLRGMTKDNGKIWRPLLKFHRIEIILYLQKYKLAYIVDSTNLKSDFRRNFLRNKVIPLIKEEWKGFETAMDKTIQNLDSENQLVESFISNLLTECEGSLQISSILESPSPLLLIKRFIDPYGPFKATPEEVLSAIKANKPHIRRWRLKYGILILRNGRLFIEMIHSESGA